MSNPFFYDNGDELSMFQAAMMGRAGGISRRFDEYYRCYPIAMMPGPDRDNLNHGGKVFMPASALEKLTRLHITYPMLFELINGAKEKMTHAGVLEFTAEEGKIYLPYWLMNTLLLEAGDLLQVKSTDLSPGSFIKLQPQSPAFLDISDPKAVLENAFRNFSCMTVGDIFSFGYNDEVYEIAVLEIKPDNGTRAICTMETDLSVDFAEPVGYQEHLKAQKAANPQAGGASGTRAGGKIHTQGTMAQAINYAAIAPSSGTAAKGEQAVSSHFAASGQRLGNKRTSKPLTGTSTPLGNTTAKVPRLNGGNGPQPLRLPPNKLFFGFEYKPPRKNGGAKDDQEQTKKNHFDGRGQNLRGKVVESMPDVEPEAETSKDAADPAAKGRTLRDAPR